MGRAELLDKLNQLPATQRLAVEQLIEALAASSSDKGSLGQAMAAARGCVRPGVAIEAIDTDVQAMRAEWDGRSWPVNGV